MGTKKNMLPMMRDLFVTSRAKVFVGTGSSNFGRWIFHAREPGTLADGLDDFGPLDDYLCWDWYLVDFWDDMSHLCPAKFKSFHGKGDPDGDDESVSVKYYRDLHEL